MQSKTCSDCHAVLKDEQTCLDHFHMMGYWELDHQLYDVHHLMVLSYYLQHPGSLSMEWLANAKMQLVAYLEKGITPQQMRKQLATEVNSSNRTYKIKATPESTAHYEYAIQWTMTALDVVAGSIENYYTNVETWARSILHALRQSNNLREI